MQIKRILSMVFVILLIVFFLPIRANCSSSDLSLCVSFPNNNNLTFSCFQQKGSDISFLYLPYNLASSDAHLFFFNTLYTNEDIIGNDEILELIQKKEPTTISVDGSNYRLQILESSEIPSLYITTSSGSLEKIHEDKNYKESGTVTIIENGCISGETLELSYIKGRGNTTWTAEKKPYNIKLKEKKNLFNMGSAKKWTLLANSFDPTLLKNAVAYDLAQNTSLQYTVEFQHIDLYINSFYQGNYLLCESVEVDKERVNITDLEKKNEDVNNDVNLGSVKSVVDVPADNNQNDDTSLQEKRCIKKWVPLKFTPDDITGGYLLEFSAEDKFQSERCGFVSERGSIITLKSPDNATKDEIDYISSLYQELEDALFSKNGFNKNGKHYSEYLDINSIVDSYLIFDFTQDEDEGQYSWFLYKDTGSELFYGGPAWDFDYSMEEVDPYPWGLNIFYLGQTNRADIRGSVINFCCMHEDFLELSAARWPMLSDYINQIQIEKIRNLRNQILHSAVADTLLWNSEKTTSFSDSTLEEMEAAYIEVSDQLLSYLPARAEILSSGLSNRNSILEELAKIDEEKDIRKTDTNNVTTGIIVISVIILITIPLVAIVVSHKKKKNASLFNKNDTEVGSL